MTGAVALTTADLLEKLRFRFAWPEFALLEEVEFGGDRTFTDRYSRADAIAIGQWHSAGYGLQGFEVKCSRSDWMKEVRTVGKADAAVRFCSRFWLVAPEGVASIEEIPGPWGWMVPHGQTLRIRRQATHVTPEPLTPGLIAKLIGKAIRRGSREGEFEKRMQEEYARGVEAGKAAEERRWSPERREELVRAVERFEAASGVKISEGWTLGDVGAAVKFVRNGGLERRKKKLENEAASLLDALRALAPILPEIPMSPYSSKRIALAAMLEAAGVEIGGEERW